MSYSSPTERLDSRALGERRMRSALASQGTSKEAIYRAVLSTTKAAALSGEVLDFGAGTGVLMADFWPRNSAGR